MKGRDKKIKTLEVKIESIKLDSRQWRIKLQTKLDLLLKRPIEEKNLTWCNFTRETCNGGKVLIKRGKN